MVAIQGMLTGLLGNLTLLSYFVKKKEVEAAVVQTLGVVSIYIVIAQLAMAGAVPLPQFTVISVVVAAGLFLNFLYYFGRLSDLFWFAWEDFVTIGGLSVLPQVRSWFFIWRRIDLVVIVLIGEIDSDFPMFLFGICRLCGQHLFLLYQTAFCQGRFLAVWRLWLSLWYMIFISIR